MEIRLVIALTSYKEDIWKVSVIQITTLYCISLSSLREWKSNTSLKCHNWKL